MESFSAVRTVSVVCPVDHNETDVEINGNNRELRFVQMDKNELKQFEKKGL